MRFKHQNFRVFLLAMQSDFLRKIYRVGSARLHTERNQNKQKPKNAPIFKPNVDFVIQSGYQVVCEIPLSLVKQK